MRKLTLFIIILALYAGSASARTWTLKNGQIVNGEFHRIENQWIVVLTDHGEKRPINIAHLEKKDKIYARNLAAILGNKPPEIEATDPAKRVQIPGKKPPAPPEKKPSVTLTLEPEVDIEPKTITSEQKVTVEVEEPKAPEENNVAEQQPDVKLKPPETPKTIAQTPDPQSSTLTNQKKRVTKTIKKSNLLILADALDSSLKKNKNITMYFLILSLLILIHKIHMPHLYKSNFKPGANQPKGSIKKEFDKDDDRERYRTCPFCKLTNPTSAQQCQHCGQFLK